MTIESIAKEMAEQYDNEIAKAFVFQVWKLLKAHGIEVRLTQKEHEKLIEEGKKFLKYTRSYELNFTDVDTSEHDAEVIDDFAERLLEDLITMRDKKFDIAKGTAMPERYTYLKVMDTLDMVIEMVKINAEQLKEKKE